jgi:hypothetical protein
MAHVAQYLPIKYEALSSNTNTTKKMKKKLYIDTIDYYSALKKNEIMSFAEKWMELEVIMLSEISQTQKDKYHIFAHIWNLDILLLLIIIIIIK